MTELQLSFADSPALSTQRFPLPAFMIIATVRGFLLNFGVYHATRSALQLPFEVRADASARHVATTAESRRAVPPQWSPAITFITCFVTLFATVIAITKVWRPTTGVLLTCSSALC